MELKEMLAAQAKEAVYGLNMLVEAGVLNGIDTEYEPRWNGAVLVRGTNTWFGISAPMADSGTWGHIWVTAEGNFTWGTPGSILVA